MVGNGVKMSPTPEIRKHVDLYGGGEKHRPDQGAAVRNGKNPGGDAARLGRVNQPLKLRLHCPPHGAPSGARIPNAIWAAFCTKLTTGGIE